MSVMPFFEIKDQQGNATGKKIFYAEKGEGDLLIFLHSWYQAGQNTFAPYIEHFSQNYRVVIPDLPGHAQSYRTLPSNFTLEMAAKELSSMVKEIQGESKTVTLIGASMGSHIALCMGLNSPETFDHLVLISAMVDFKVNEYRIEQTLALSGAPIRAALLWKALKGRFPFDGRHAKYWMRDKTTPGKFAHFRQIMKMHSIHDAKAYLKSFLTATLREEVSQNELPTLMIYGKRDKLTPSDFRASMAKKMPRAMLRIHEGAGHNLYLNRPKEVIEMIDEFLEEHKKRKFRWLSMFWKR